MKPKLSPVEAVAVRSERDAHKHTTASEIRFIRSMLRPDNPRPLEAIRSYRRALELRRDWTGMNRSEVFGFIDQLLSNAGAAQ